MPLENRHDTGGKMNWGERHNILLSWWLFLGLLLVLCLALHPIAHAQEPVSCLQVCPPCNVKAEWTGEAYEYEYADYTAVITGTTPLSVCWQSQGGYTVSSVCIKAGQMLFWPDPSDGCWETPWQDISHVVVCTEEPTAIGLVEFRASVGSGVSLMLFLISCIGMLLGLCIIAWAERRRR